MPQVPAYSSTVAFLPKAFTTPPGAANGQYSSFQNDLSSNPGWDGTISTSSTISFIIASPVSQAGQYGLLSSFVPLSAPSAGVLPQALTGYYSNLNSASIYVGTGSAMYYPILAAQPDPPMSGGPNIPVSTALNPSGNPATSGDWEVAIPTVSIVYNAVSSNCPSPPPPPPSASNGRQKLVPPFEPWHFC